MPKFMYTLVFLFSTSWVGILLMLLFVEPNNHVNIFLFLALLFVGLFLLFSLLFYFLKKISSRKKLTNHRKMYRMGVKKSFFLTFFIVGFLTLSAFNLFSLVNGGLFAALFAAIYFYVR